MKLNHIFSAACLAIGLSGTGAQADTLNLTEILNYTEGEFRSSLIHNQSCGSMCGTNLADFDSALTSGTYDTVTGAIDFTGTISRAGDSSTFEAGGNLAASARPDGLFGSITFEFLGDLFDGMVLSFEFADENFTTGDEPNGFASNGTNDFIALWGDTGKYLNGGVCEAYHCYGIDLRLAYETDGGGGGGVVPLPASFGFLLAGLGGLGVTRKLRKKA